MPKACDLAEAAPIFAALGDPIRLQLITRLSHEGPASISHLGDGVGVTRQAVTKHLEVLAGAGLVESHREGRERIWALEPKRLTAAQSYLEHIAEGWDEALGRLRTFVED